MEELLRRLKHKDECAFESIVKIFENQLYTIAKIRLRDDFLAKDAVQETFFSLFLNSKHIKNEEKLKSWLTIVLINKCNDIAKKNKIIQVSFEQNYFENFTYSEDDFKKLIDKIDFYSNISLLSVEERTIIAMYYDGNYSLKEISEILNISSGTIKSKISRAKVKLRKKMGGE
ncbi:MAG: RNA polymerase sigma factor [Clostridia bacterium]